MTGRPTVLYITVGDIKDPTEGAIYSGDTVADYVEQGWGIVAMIPTNNCVHYILAPPAPHYPPEGAPVEPPQPGEL